MDAEQIVQMGKTCPYDRGHHRCRWCQADGDAIHRNLPGKIFTVVDIPEGHEPDCPWRLARKRLAKG